MARNRTWYTDMNVAYPDTSTSTLACKSWLWTFKSLLKGVTTGTNGPEGAPPAGALWTVTGSSDGTTADFDSVDRTTDAFDGSKWVRNAAHTGAHTWVCLRNNAGNRWILLSWVGANDYNASLYFATSAFSGGGTSSRPTSTTEWKISEHANNYTDIIQFSDNLAVPYRMHMTRDANGNFYVLASRNGSTVFHSLVGFVDCIETASVDTQPHVGFYAYVAGGVVGRDWATVWAMVGSTYHPTTSTPSAAGFVGLYCSVPGWQNIPPPALPNSDGEVDLFPITVQSLLRNDNSATTSYKGLLPDIYQGPSTGAGSLTPTGTPLYMNTAGVWFPFSVAPLL